MELYVFVVVLALIACATSILIDVPTAYTDSHITKTSYKRIKRGLAKASNEFERKYGAEFWRYNEAKRLLDSEAKHILLKDAIRVIEGVYVKEGGLDRAEMDVRSISHDIYGFVGHKRLEVLTDTTLLEQIFEKIGDVPVPKCLAYLKYISIRDKWEIELLVLYH